MKANRLLKRSHCPRQRPLLELAASLPKKIEEIDPSVELSVYTWKGTRTPAREALLNGHNVTETAMDTARQGFSSSAIIPTKSNFGQVPYK